MGTDAVVVSAGRRRRGRLPFLSRTYHELIAVVDDRSTGGTCGGDTVSDDQIQRIATLYERNHGALEASLRKLEYQVQTLRRAENRSATIQSADVAAWAADWDPRFVASLQGTAPSFFSDPESPARRHALVERLAAEPDFRVVTDRGPHTIAMVGPTGSGKTTTVAKLASRWSLDEGLKVGLITTDTYRVAAVDQIKEYATLLGIELRVVFSARAAREAVLSLSDRDVILVDTPGRSHLDAAGLTALKGILQGMGPTTVMLLIPAPVDRQCAAEILANFGVLDPDYLVLSKADETSSYGLITAISSETDLPFAYRTDGQRVPRDICPLSSDILAEMLLPLPQTTGAM